MDFSTAVWRTPLIVALVLLPVRNQRLGGSGGPSYVARASMTARNRARDFLEAHFTIVPKPVNVTGWRLGTHTLSL